MSPHGAACSAWQASSAPRVWLQSRSVAAASGVCWIDRQRLTVFHDWISSRPPHTSVYASVVGASAPRLEGAALLPTVPPDHPDQGPAVVPDDSRPPCRSVFGFHPLPAHIAVDAARADRAPVPIHGPASDIPQPSSAAAGPSPPAQQRPGHGTHSSSSAPSGTLCATPLWQSMHVLPLVCICSCFFCAERSWALRSQAAALWQARHSRESLAFM
jgi:hypothetical protein